VSAKDVNYPVNIRQSSSIKNIYKHIKTKICYVFINYRLLADIYIYIYVYIYTHTHTHTHTHVHTHTFLYDCCLSFKMTISGPQHVGVVM